MCIICIRVHHSMPKFHHIFFGVRIQKRDFSVVEERPTPTLANCSFASIVSLIVRPKNWWFMVRRMFEWALFGVNGIFMLLLVLASLNAFYHSMILNRNDRKYTVSGFAPVCSGYSLRHVQLFSGELEQFQIVYSIQGNCYLFFCVMTSTVHSFPMAAHSMFCCVLKHHHPGPYESWVLSLSWCWMWVKSTMIW